MKSLILKENCKVCNKPATEVSRYDFLGSIIVKLQCGHELIQASIPETDYSSVKSSDGRTLMPYQVNGVKFLEAANGRALIADEQGLGKTVQAAAFLKLHGEVSYPVIVVTKTTLKIQWFSELIRWTGNRSIQLIQSSKDLALPGFDIYITTYDLLKDEKVFSLVNPKTLILDECQAIKNHLSGRAKAVQRIGANCEHIIGLSGTPIKNNAGEYFTILNLLQPKRFPELSRFLRTYCDSYETMYGYKVGGLTSVDRFREVTDDFIIRRTKSEVLPDLPALTRNFYHVDLDKKLESAYDSAMNELDALFYKDDDSQESMTAMIAVMTKLRQICGVSKVTECIDFVTDFLLSCDRKIVIFVHHHAVASLLETKLNQWLTDGNYDKVLTLAASGSAESKAETVKQFRDSSARVLIASTLAAGEGLNLQFCSDAIMLERQWNPANEEQAEARFHRFGQMNPVTITYMIAVGRIDEYFTEIVENKRAIVNNTLDGKDMKGWDQTGLMRELAETLIRTGKKKWTL